MPLLTFYQIFRIINDNTLEFIHDTKVGDVEFDAGARINKGIIVAGIDFFKYIGSDMEVTKDGTTHVIERVYF